MPRRDGTGPAGAGPLTGWGAGFCTGTRVQGGRRAAWCRGGFGTGRGPRWRNCGPQGMVMGQGWPTSALSAGDAAESTAGNREQEVILLKQQAEAMKSQLEQLSRQLAELKRAEPHDQEPHSKG